MNRSIVAGLVRYGDKTTFYNAGFATAAACTLFVAPEACLKFEVWDIISGYIEI